MRKRDVAYRVYRGGGWWLDSSYCRASARVRNEPGFRAGILGFRFVLVRRMST